MLMLTQLALLIVATRSPSFRRVLEGKPVLVFFEGHYLDDVLRKHGLWRDDVRAAVRGDGVSDLKSVGGVVYEVDGVLQIVPRSQDGAYPVLETVEHYPPASLRRATTTTPSAR